MLEEIVGVGVQVEVRASSRYTGVWSVLGEAECRFLRWWLALARKAGREGT